MVTYRLADMTDGTSNTLMMMEVRQGLISQDLRGLTWWGPGSGVTAHYTPNTSSPDLLNSGFCVNNPQAGMPCTGSSGFYNATAPVTFSSRSVHPGGVQVALGDGSVRFVSETVALLTWRNLSTMADGLPVGDF
jgi:prepilin-type processing-associated H-X9-DG protein